MRGFNALDWFRAGGTLLVASCTVLGALSLDASIRDWRRSDHALERLQVFELAFTLSTAINSERRPLELALGSERGASIGLVSELLGARISSDIALTRLRRSVEGLSDTDTPNFTFLEAKLKGERARADVLLALPLAQRRIGEQLSVIRGMTSAAETAAPIVTRTARHVIMADADLAGPVNVARLLGALYESASQLPSQIVPVVKARQTLPPEVRMTALRLQQRILALWDVGAAQLEFGSQGPKIEKAISDIRDLFFGKGFPFLSRTLERYSNRAPADDAIANNLAQVYSPTISPIALLRDRYVTQMMTDAREHRTEAMQRAVISIGLTGMILLILPILVWKTFREILRPLLQFRDRILAICEDTSVSTEPYEGSVPAVRHLYRALETLQARDGERRELDRERADLAERLRALSETDDLTGLLNRRGLWRELQPFGSRLTNIGLVVTDIDHFKRINDNHGHVEGDRVLQAFSRQLASVVSEDVVVARYGGEEFALALRGRSPEEMLALIERLRADIEGMSVRSQNGREIRLTASFGLTHAQGPVEDWEALFRQADIALYAAKMSGRNRVRATNEVLAQLGDPASHPASLKTGHRPRRANGSDAR